MSRITPLKFQQIHVQAILDRFSAHKATYDGLGSTPDPAQLSAARKNGACVLFQAPTGIGKTLMACEVLAEFSAVEKILWFWFAPFAGVISQAKSSLARQASNLTLLNIESDRKPENLTNGGIFVLTWQTVAAKSAAKRVARQGGDAGWSLDDLIAQAREEGYRIGVVVDEAHHGFVKAAEAPRYFSEVLQPDYVLMMTATPRDADAQQFSTLTGYRIGGQDEWASIPRKEGVDAQLLKRSVKAARFIVQNADDAELVAFEEVALSECAAMHRLIKQTLVDRGIGVTPLMLVQVPNGDEAIKQAKDFLVKKLRFPETAVKAHTSLEPDPNLEAMANDPSVEVILFKMAIATGFDAPRAFTLAALRGTRDKEFGIQVVGRIMRVHRELQGKLDGLPKLLSDGYVFLANSAAQEGLVSAASQINQMPAQLAKAATTTLVTVVSGEPQIQIVKQGQNLTLLPSLPVQQLPSEPIADGEASSAPPQAGNNASNGAATTETPAPPEGQISLFQVLATPGVGLTSGFRTTTALTNAFKFDSEQTSAYSYTLKEGSPRVLTTEFMPAVPEDFEARLVNCINFGSVLGDRLKVRSKVTERTTDVFQSQDGVEDKDVWATVSATAIAEKARQLAFAFDDVDRRELLAAMKSRFKETLLNEGHEPPDDDEELTRQLELVLVRNPRLIKDAHKRLRAEQVTLAQVHLPAALVSETALSPAARNIYGVMPPDLNEQEEAFALLLDTSPLVLWWHRNAPSVKRSGVGLYRWSEGVGFFPDFVVKIADRSDGEGVALSEVKGAHLQEFDKAKAGAVHETYGRVFMVGKPKGEEGFHFWRLSGSQLLDDGRFEIPRMRFSS